MTAAAWSKTAFAVTLLRFSEGWTKWFVWFILVSINIIIALNATMNWKSWIPSTPGTCANILPQIIFIGNLAGGYSAASDFVLALLPWVIIWNLQMRLKEKIGVGVAMSLGTLERAGIMALIKTLHLGNLATGDTYDAAMLNIWDSTEVSVTIIAASIPSLRVYLRDIVSNAAGRYGTHEGPISVHGSKNQQYSVGVRSRARHPLEKRSNAGSDDSILGMDASGKIMRVDEIMIDREGETDDAVELQQVAGQRRKQLPRSFP
ncbi:hypothetical protein OQA88_10957 [Cercophora sp. LCS_1]